MLHAVYISLSTNKHHWGGPFLLLHEGQDEAKRLFQRVKDAFDHLKLVEEFHGISWDEKIPLNGNSSSINGMIIR